MADLRLGELGAAFPGCSWLVQFLSALHHGKELLEALGTTESEAGQLIVLSEGIFRDSAALVATHSTLETKPWPNEQEPVGEVAVLQVGAFAVEGAALRDRFRGQLNAVLGPERAEAFWQQAEPTFRDVLNEFGAQARRTELVRNGDKIDGFDFFKDSSRERPSW